MLDLNEQAATAVAEKIVKDGGIAKAYKCNVLDKENLKAVHDEIAKDFGLCDILINGAGGNNPKCTTLHEEFEKGDEAAEGLLGAVDFLLDEEKAGFVTGVTIPIGGGFSAYSGV